MAGLIKSVILIVFFWLALFASQRILGGRAQETEFREDEMAESLPEPYAVKAMEGDYGFGYQIFINGQPVISQPNIPALSGNKAFATREDALSVGRFAAQKIKEGTFPPTISTEELVGLGIIK